MNTLLVEYPFLRVNETDDRTWLDEFEPGWQKAFGIDFCEELKEALIKDNKLNSFAFIEIKEKYGMLDIFSINAGNYASRVLDKYESLSQFYCAHCGKPARYVYTTYIYPVCEECIKNFDGGPYKAIERFHDFDDYSSVQGEVSRLKHL